ncbi:MAG: hypothetical protein HN729_05880 [Candidatus Marinimicrobia bacterium]|jgi:hypothetical protein|nr:hypothetical protein [Candidatus Neomarinimicrobiota bacterium]
MRIIISCFSSITTIVSFLVATPQLAILYWDVENAGTPTLISGEWELYYSDGEYIGTYSTGVGNPITLTLNESYIIKSDILADANTKSFLHWNLNDLTHISRIQTLNDVTDQSYSLSSFYLSKDNASIQTTDDVEIWIHDPWLTDANDEPYDDDHFVPLSNLTSTGTYEIFEDRGGQINDMVYPYYKLKVKRLISNSNGIY